MLSKFLLLVLVACLSTLVTAAPQFWLSAITTGQGQLFNTTSTLKSAPANSVQVQSFNFSATSPRDVATGQATGRTTATPLTITRAIDKNTPAVFLAMVTNRVLQKVTLTTFEPGITGALTRTLEYTLTNANLGSVAHDGEGDGLTEKLTFVFRSIEVAYGPSVASFSPATQTV